MNEPDSLKQDLRALGAELRTAPSVAAAVLKRIALKEVDLATAQAQNILDSSSDSGFLVPRRTANQSKSTESALPSRERRRSYLLPSFSVAGVLLACAVLVFVLLRSDSIAFAQVLERVAAARTATFTYKHAILVRLPGGKFETRELSRRILVRSDGRIRTEESGGIVSILSPDDFIKLVIDPANRTATQRYLYEIEDKQDLLATLRSLHQTPKAIPLAPREIRGVSCPGFKIEEQKSVLLVWVDPKTRLPVHAERSFSKSLTEKDRDILGVVDTFSEMKFGEPLADELFSISAPAGWKVVTVGTPPADRKALFAEPLVLIPNVGAGPLKFGMLRAEIVRLLGKPDKEEVHIPNIPVTKDTTEIDGKIRPPSASLIVLTELHVLRYHGLGLSLTLETTEGLRGIQCLSQERLGPEGRTFKGATDKKIHIGSKVDEVLKAYGEADEKRTGPVWRYARLHLDFVLSEKEIVQEIHLSDSFEHRLRFEWGMPNP